MALKPLYGLTVDVELHWGLSLNYFSGTKSRPALRVIPPTTIVGAIARPLARLRGAPENADGGDSGAEPFKGMFVGVYYSVLRGALVPYAELSKVWFYKVRENRAKPDAAALPKLYAKVPTSIRLYYVIDAVQASKTLGEGWVRALEGAAWSITRLGAKESIVSVTAVTASPVKEVRAEGAIVTSATVPLHNADFVDGEHIVAEVIDWRKARMGRYFGAPTARVAQPVGVLHSRSEVKVGVKGGVAYEVASPSGTERLVPW